MLGKRAESAARIADWLDDKDLEEEEEQQLLGQFFFEIIEAALLAFPITAGARALNSWV